MQRLTINVTTLYFTKPLEDFEKKANLAMKKWKLTDEEKKKLLMKLRFKFMSHEAIMKASKSPVIEPFRELFIEGLSSKLKPFEDTSNNYSVLMEPRTNYMNARTNPNGGQAQSHYDMAGPQTQQTHMAG